LAGVFEDGMAVAKERDTAALAPEGFHLFDITPRFVADLFIAVAL
jgi:hypothetical protein